MDERILKVSGTHVAVKNIVNCINIKENIQKIYKADLIIIIVKCLRSLIALLNIFLLQKTVRLCLLMTY